MTWIKITPDPYRTRIGVKKAMLDMGQSTTLHSEGREHLLGTIRIQAIQNSTQRPIIELGGVNLLTQQQLGVFPFKKFMQSEQGGTTGKGIEDHGQDHPTGTDLH